MMIRILVALTVLACAGTRTAMAQDALTAAPDHYRVLVENEHVRVVQNTLPAGGKDSTHTHPAGWYYVTKGGSMKIVFSNGRTAVWTPATGESAWSAAEPAHTSENIGTEPMSYVLVEVKSAARRHATGRTRAHPQTGR